jgi:hypothetical protein
MASTDNTVAHTLRDLGLAAWFGGSLMGAAGVNGAAAKGRLAGQQGVAKATSVKTSLTVAALGATAYARPLCKKLERAGDIPMEGGTTPTTTPGDVARAQVTGGLVRRLLPGRWPADSA